MNSSIMTEFVRYHVKELKSGYYEAYPNQIAELPFIYPIEDELIKINNLVLEILKNPFSFTELQKKIDNKLEKLYCFSNSND